ncbi:MAG: hypothetical protein HN952_04965 [Candidatus Cloacimonetes bacterium]|jgi:hypothetical protein|nr:hypothetical protein [Candidatus Cloacimonadota bacterium]MBT6994291.1 hypothetical protein [Candidatus Cloacimonadota bacterium]
MTDNFKKRLIEIIETSFRLLEMKIANGGIISNNEASFQLELGYILKVVGQLYEFQPNEKFHLELENYIDLKETSIKSKSKKARVDIYLEFGNENEKIKGAIELKFLKKRNHREPNNRYDIFKDISNLEAYKENGIDICFFYISTDHSHYVNQPDYSIDTSDFDFRDGSEYKKGKILNYNTKKSYGKPIELKGSYKFKWTKPSENIYFMKLEI